MKIRHLHGISIHKTQRANTSTSEICCRGTSQAAGTDKKDLGMLYMKLALNTRLAIIHEMGQSIRTKAYLAVQN
jgi:hypothetical protein